MDQISQYGNTESSQTSWGRLGPLAAISIVALLVRCFGLSKQCFSNDEVVDLEIARQTWSSIFYMADGFPPLHHFLLKAALLLTNNDMSGRWLALAYGVLTVPLLGLLGERIGGKRCSLAAAGLLAISPMHVYFSQEGRAYGLFFLLTVLASWLFWRALQENSGRNWTLLAVFASLGGYAHYYYVFVLMVFVLIWIKHSLKSGNWLPGLYAFCGIGLLSLPVLVIVGSDIGCQQAMRKGDFSFATVGYIGWSLLTGFCIGPSLRELHAMTPPEAIREILPWIIPVGAIVGGLLASVLRKQHPYRFELLSLLVIPIACAFLAEVWLDVSNFNVRYVLPSLMPVIILMAVALTSSNHQRIATALGLTFLVVSTCSILNRQRVDTYRNEDAKSACNRIVAVSAKPAPVYTIAHYMHTVTRYYLPAGYEVVPVEDVTTDKQNLQETLQLINTQAGRFWIFYSREFHGDPDGIFKRRLLDSPQIEHMGTYAGVELYRGMTPLTAPSELLVP